MRIKIVTYNEGLPNETKHCLYQCPGCGYEHGFNPHHNPWNNDVDWPTVQDLLRTTGPHLKRCHAYITDGWIYFLGDSEHEAKAKTMLLPDYYE